MQVDFTEMTEHSFCFTVTATRTIFMITTRTKLLITCCADSHKEEYNLNLKYPPAPPKKAPDESRAFSLPKTSRYNFGRSVLPNRAVAVADFLLELYGMCRNLVARYINGCFRFTHTYNYVFFETILKVRPHQF